MAKKQSTKYIKAAQGLGVFQNTQKITHVVKQKAKYPVTECFNVLKNLWAKPKYTQLHISSYAWYKLMAFIHLVGDFEISGFGRIQNVSYKLEDGSVVAHPTITDFDIIKQEVKPAYVESDADAVAEFLRNLPPAEIPEWTLDWHSHVNMGTTPSGTDWTNYADMLGARLGNQFPAMIVNKKGNITSYQIISEERHEPIKVCIIEQELPETDLVQIYNECKVKVEELCSKPAVTTTTTTTNYTYGNNWSGYGQRANWGSKKAEAYDAYDYGYDYDYDPYGTTGKRWWEEEDEEVAEAKKQGFVFEDEAPEYDMLCAECGKPLNPQNLEEINMGVCSECFDKALRS